ncbi:MAG: porin, partial [Betaproteobacteria bacterium]
TLPNNLKVGAQMSQQTATTSVGNTSQVKSYHVGIDWMFSGPHGVRAAYSHAGDVTGTGAATTTRVAPGANTGGSLYSVRYVYQLSKATTLAAGYASVKNSAAARYALGGASTTVPVGTSASGFGLSVKSTF